MVMGANAATTKLSIGVADISATLAGFGLKGKPHVANPKTEHRGGVRRPKKIYWEKIKSPVQRVFVIRVNEELDAKGWSDNILSAICDDQGNGIGQSSVSRITGGRQDPSLEMVHAIASGLDMPAWKLLTHADGEKAHSKVVQFPQPERIMQGGGRESRIPKRRRKLKG